MLKKNEKDIAVDSANMVSGPLEDYVTCLHKVQANLFFFFNFSISSL